MRIFNDLPPATYQRRRRRSRRRQVSLSKWSKRDNDAEQIVKSVKRRPRRTRTSREFDVQEVERRIECVISDAASHTACMSTRLVCTECEAQWERVRAAFIQARTQQHTAYECNTRWRLETWYPSIHPLSDFCSHPSTKITHGGREGTEDAAEGGRSDAQSLTPFALPDYAAHSSSYQHISTLVTTCSAIYVRTLLRDLVQRDTTPYEADGSGPICLGMVCKA